MAHKNMNSRKFTASKKILLNSIPKSLREKLGDDKVLKLCTSVKYRKHRKDIPKCSHCGHKKVRFRSMTREYVCEKCNLITPAKSRLIGCVIHTRLFAPEYEDAGVGYNGY